MSALPEIERALARYQPEILDDEGRRRAAVALVLRPGAGGRTEALFIERAEHPHDPWSGHMALPGGRVDPSDPDARFAAERETREEVGLDLSAGRRIGRLDDLEGRHAGRPVGLLISAFVYRHPDPGPLVLNHEVSHALWVPVDELVAPQRQVEVPRAVAGRRFPGIRVGDSERHIVWGLTYRFLELFLSAVGRPLPDRWGQALGAAEERA